MKRYQTCFQDLTNKREIAFIPFVVLGDPSPEITLMIIDTLVMGGADGLELGLPFSDPLADGPVIQNSMQRALNNNVTVSHCFSLINHIRRKYPHIPIGLLTYANLVFQPGINNFYVACVNAGIDSVLIADVPIEEYEPFYSVAIRHEIAPIFICPPNADNQFLHYIASHGQGYTYLLSRSGITGADSHTHDSLASMVKKLNQFNAPPVVQGFGISTPQDIRQAKENGVAGVISGSVIVKIIEKFHDNPIQLRDNILNFVKNMKEATYS